MNRLRELYEQLLDQFQTQWNKFTETTFYIQVRERYEDLSAPKQKIVQAAAALVAFLVLLSVPLSYFSTASDEMTRFETLRELTRDLLRVTRTQNAPSVESMSSSQLAGKIRDELRGFRLSEDQIKKVEPIPANQMALLKLAPAQIQEDGVEVTVLGLNLKQIVDVSHRLANMGETTKLSGMSIQSTAKAGFFDLTMQVSAFSANPPKDDKGSSKKKRRSKEADE